MKCHLRLEALASLLVVIATVHCGRNSNSERFAHFFDTTVDTEPVESQEVLAIEVPPPTSSTQSNVQDNVPVPTDVPSTSSAGPVAGKPWRLSDWYQPPSSNSPGPTTSAPQVQMNRQQSMSGSSNFARTSENRAQGNGGHILLFANKFEIPLSGQRLDTEGSGHAPTYAHQPYESPRYDSPPPRTQSTPPSSPFLSSFQSHQDNQKSYASSTEVERETLSDLLIRPGRDSSLSPGAIPPPMVDMYHTSHTRTSLDRTDVAKPRPFSPYSPSVRSYSYMYPNGAESSNHDAYIPHPSNYRGSNFHNHVPRETSPMSSMYHDFHAAASRALEQMSFSDLYEGHGSGSGGRLAKFDFPGHSNYGQMGGDYRGSASTAFGHHGHIGPETLWPFNDHGHDYVGSGSANSMVSSAFAPNFYHDGVPRSTYWFPTLFGRK